MGGSSPYSDSIPAILVYRLLCCDPLARIIQERGTGNSIQVDACMTDHLQDKEPASDSDMSIKAVYKTIWTICQLKRIPSFLFNIQDLILLWQMSNFS